jgi:pimeloyl-ACP methyl ester carboxylesterase
MSTYLADAAEDLSADGPPRRSPIGAWARGTIDWWDPELLDYLSADDDVIVFDNIGTGYTDGTPHDSVEGFADGAIEFIDALGLPHGPPSSSKPAAPISENGD